MWSTVRTTWSLLSARQRWVYIMLTAGQLFANVFDLLGIAAVGLLVMAVASGRIDFELSGLFRITVDETPPALIIGLVAAAGLAFFLKAAFNLVLSLALVRYMAGIEVEAATRVARHILSGDLANLRRFSQADVGYAVNASTGALFSGVLGSVSAIVTGLGLFSFILTTFFLLNPVAAVVVGVYLAVMVLVIQWLVGDRLKEIGRNVNRGTVAAASAIFDSVRAFREISVLKKQEFFLRRFSKARRLLARTTATSTVLKNLPRLIIEQGLMLGVLGFAAWQLFAFDTPTGLASIGVFLVGSVRIIGAVVPVQNSYAALKTIAVKAELAQSLNLEIRDLYQSAQAEEAGREHDEFSDDATTELGLSISFSNVTYTYADGDLPAVRNVTFSAPGGSFIALVGPSGAGKTTIADLVLGLYSPQVGEVRISGQNPRVLREESPGLISYVPQRPGMVSGSIAQNVALGIADSEIDEGWVWHCLERAALDDVVRGIPDGIYASLGKQSDQLSGGQLQRLGLARALYPKPRLIILDEATSALDANSEAAVSSNIRELGEAVTLVVIAHRLSTIQHADCVYVVDGGEILASGPFSTLRKTVPMIEESVRLMSFDDTEK